MKIVLVGNFSPGHVGSSLLNAAEQLGVHAVTAATNDAYAGPRWLARLSSRLPGRRPPRLRRFSESVVALCREHSPDHLLSTGSAPLDAEALRLIGTMGVRRVNYSTDDPWSKSHRSRWLLDALKEYDAIYSPRRSNLEQLRILNGGKVVYLPFAFDPAHRLIATDDSADVHGEHSSDVLFVGGADRDRVNLVRELLREGMNVSLYGGYWERYSATRAAARGIATPEAIRLATRRARISLCLVRRSNRDGHVMRSFETAALGACMLVEGTDEHREIFGEEGDTVLFFHTPKEMVEKVRWLLANPSVRVELGRKVRARVATETNTYAARLAHMLESDAPSGHLAPL